MNLTILDLYNDILVELQQAWEQVQASGKLHIVLIQGESGMYKTGVIRHFLDSSRASVIIGHGSDISEAYLPLRLAFESLVRIEQVQTQLSKPSEQVSPDWQMILTAWAQLLPLLNLTNDPVWELLARWQPFTPRHSMSAESIEADAPLRSITLPGLFTVALGELSALMPTVFFLDNLNMADAATLEALRFDILPALGNSSVLFVAAFEPPADINTNSLGDLVRFIEGMPQAQSLSLPLLDKTRVEVVLRDQLIIWSEVFGVDLASCVHQATRGNLAQVLDIINWLKTLDTAAVDGMLSIPEYASLIQQQFEQLSTIEQQVLQTASVQGGYFCREAVAMALGHSPEEIVNVLAQIEQKIETVTRFDTTVALQDRQLHWHHFRSQRTQTWLYQSIPAGKKKEYHQKTALALETVYGKETDAIISLLAQQFEKGSVPDKAAYYYAEVARQANDRGAIDQALEYAQRGLDMLGDDGNQTLLCKLRLQKGRTLMNSERAYLAEDVLRRAFSLTEQIQIPRRLEMEVLYYLGELLLNRNVWDEGMELVGRALELAIEQKAWPMVVEGMEKLRSRYSRQDPQAFLTMCNQMIAQIRQNQSPAAKVAIAEILEDKAWLYYQKRRYAEALETLRQVAIGLHSTDLLSRSPEIRYKLHRLRAQIFRALQKYSQSLEEAEHALAWAKASYSRANIVRAHDIKATTLRHMGRISEGEQEYETALALLDNTSDLVTLAEIEGGYGILLSYSGRERRAREFYERSYTHRREIGYLYGLQIAQNNLAAIDKHLGFFQSALTTYQQLYSEGLAQGDMSRQNLSLNHIGDIHRMLNCLDEAERAHRQAIQLCNDIDQLGNKAIALHYLGRMFLCSWRLDEAQSTLNEAEAMIQDHKTADRRDRPHNQIYLGRLALCEGNLADSSRRLKRAIETLGELQNLALVGIGYLNLGLLLLVEGQPADALAAAQGAFKALQSTESWRVCEAQHLLARCYLALGDFERAQQEIERAKASFMDLGLSHRVFQAESTELHIQDAQETGEWEQWQRLDPDNELRFDFNHLGI